MKPILEELAIELETLQRGAAEKGEPVDYKDLMAHVRNDGYSRSLLIQELKGAKLKFFADKVFSGYYEKKTRETKERIEANKRIIEMKNKEIEERQAEIKEIQKTIDNDTRQI